MAHTVTVNDTVARVRNEADIATGDQANSIATDAQIILWLDRAYRRLRHLASRTRALELFSNYVAIVSPWTLPADCYRVLGVDHVLSSTHKVRLRAWNILDRDRLEFVDPPRWRVFAGTLSFLPEAPSGGAVFLFYVPTPTTLAAGGSFDAIDGFDDYLVQYAVMKVRQKQEYDISADLLLLKDLERELGNEFTRMKAESTTLADVRTEPDEAYYNS